MLLSVRKANQSVDNVRRQLGDSKLVDAQNNKCDVNTNLKPNIAPAPADECIEKCSCSHDHLAEWYQSNGRVEDVVTGDNVVRDTHLATDEKENDYARLSQYKTWTDFLKDHGYLSK